jgi:hypothetical protein
VVGPSRPLGCGGPARWGAGVLPAGARASRPPPVGTRRCLVPGRCPASPLQPAGEPSAAVRASRLLWCGRLARWGASVSPASCRDEAVLRPRAMPRIAPTACVGSVGCGAGVSPAAVRAPRPLWCGRLACCGAGTPPASCRDEAVPRPRAMPRIAPTAWASSVGCGAGVSPAAVRAPRPPRVGTRRCLVPGRCPASPLRPGQDPSADGLRYAD